MSSNSSAIAALLSKRPSKYTAWVWIKFNSCKFKNEQSQVAPCMQLEESDCFVNESKCSQETCCPFLKSIYEALTINPKETCNWSICFCRFPALGTNGKQRLRPISTHTCLAGKYSRATEFPRGNDPELVMWCSKAIRKVFWHVYVFWWLVVKHCSYHKHIQFKWGHGCSIMPC